MSKIHKALISISDKKNLRPLLNVLKKYKIEIISSGGTFKEIKKLGFKSTEVSKFTETPEILDGRVKTIHPKIFGGILNKRASKKHYKDIKENDIENIDLVIVNFYPFEKIASSATSHKKIMENIDIGGPSIVRAAAKNYNDVAVICNTNQYEKFIDEIKKKKGFTSLDFREKLAEEAFMETAYYESKIFNYFAQRSNTIFPKKKIFSGKLIEETRYGENPHQKAAIYNQNNKTNLIQINGKRLSYNNYNDLYSAQNIIKFMPKNKGVVIIKHSNPCGVSINSDKFKCFQEALECDPISAYGGVISCNFKMSSRLAKAINKKFFEIVISKGFDKKSINILKKKKNVRIVDSSKIDNKVELNLLNRFDTILIQSPDNISFTKGNFKVVSKRKPSHEIMNKLIFAFNVCRNVKSNAIVITTNYKTVGIGSGQPSRLDSCKIAIEKMKKNLNIKKNNDELIAASDAFFPFVDGIEKLVQSGVTAVIQPSGSKNDKEIIKFANQTNTILVFSKTRHFTH